ncbi:Fucose-specific lectin [Glarea lozoyensis ATCC 20868]|uniref:Fucose-specific lectin n=1 Tax=Glarea lozoyensis (strain ATCC 20868 / MF5171) TaxID=1116229 RepID=S3CZ30_GLAL2|nr:Fucose-specific lectin [Glarea lozoyensis ATCC 20868]EPE30840.1 Fucose-specific lectin [Glarea lozoyensis ATCC 20868]
MEKNVTVDQLTRSNFNSSESEANHFFANNKTCRDTLPSSDAVNIEAIVDSKEDKKDFKVAVFEEPYVEPGPPPYSAPLAVLKGEEPEKKVWWKRRWVILLILAIITLLVVLLGVLLGVLLSRKGRRYENTNGYSSSGEGAGNGDQSNNSSDANTGIYSPDPADRPNSVNGPGRVTSTTSSSLPTSTAGNALPPALNTVIDIIELVDKNPATLKQTSLVKLFFQDHDGYLCEKSSSDGTSTWDLPDSGSRIMKTYSGTSIAAVTSPDNQLPIRVFFITPEGYLADIFQTESGGAWADGTLRDQQYKPGFLALATRTISISATWCKGDFPVVFVQGDDLSIKAFQLVDKKETTTTSSTYTWESVPGNYGGLSGITSSLNFDAVCGLQPAADPEENSSIVFYNTYTGTETTGHLNTAIDNDTAPVSLPASVSPLYRPNTPILTIFGDLPSLSNINTLNKSFLIFYPLPTNLLDLQSPHIHVTLATISPTTPRTKSLPRTISYSETSLDTGVKPFAYGNSAKFSEGLNVGSGITGTMPRAWRPFLLKGTEGAGGRGKVVVVYQRELGGLSMDVLIGAQGRSSMVIMEDWRSLGSR